MGPPNLTTAAIALLNLVVFAMVGLAVLSSGTMQPMLQHTGLLNRNENTNVAESLKEEAQLRLVQVVFRHGARTTLSTAYWPNTSWTVCPKTYPGVELELHDSRGGAHAPPILDPDNPRLPGGCPEGTLTSAGYDMALHLGQELRAAYIERYKLIPEEYDSNAVFAYTSSIRRTVHTLQGVLTGMYGKVAQPIPVNASTQDHEFMYPLPRNCKALNTSLEEMRELVAEEGELTQKLHWPKIIVCILCDLYCILCGLFTA
jgi:hypothetical protein